MSIDSVSYPQAAFDNAQLQQLRNQRLASLSSQQGSYADSLGLYSPSQLDGTSIASSPLAMGLSGGTSNPIETLMLLRQQSEIGENPAMSDSKLITRDKIVVNTDKADDDKDDDDDSVSESEKDDDRPKATTSENKEAVKKVEEEFKDSKRQYENDKKHKGWIGGIWDGVKNHLGASSEKVKKEDIENKGGVGHFIRKIWSKAVDSDNGSKSITKKMDDTEEKIEAAKKDPKKVDELFEQSSKKIDDIEDIIVKGNKNDKLSEEEQAIYDTVQKELDGKTSREDVRKAIHKAMTKDATTADIINNAEGKNLTTTTKAKDYKASQEAGVDTMSSIGTGIVVGTGIALAPLSFGASLAIAVPAGMALKTGLKASESISGGKDYNTFGEDLVTGALDGGFGVIMPGGSSAIATGAARTMGLSVAKTAVEKVAVEGGKAAGKEAVEAATETAAKETAKKLFAKEAGKAAVSISGDGTAKIASKSLFGKVTRKAIGKVAEEDGVMVVKNTNEKVLGTIAKNTTDGTLEITKNVGIKGAFGAKSLAFSAADGSDAAIRSGIAKATGDVVMGGVTSSTYSVADGVMRGDDAETIAQNAHTAFVGGMVGGAVIHGAGKGFSKVTSKIKNEKPVIPTGTKSSGTSSAYTVPESHAKEILAAQRGNGLSSAISPEVMKDKLQKILLNHPSVGGSKGMSQQYFEFINKEIAAGRITSEAQLNGIIKAANSNTTLVNAGKAAAQTPAPTIKFGQNTYTIEEAKAHRAYLQQALDNGAISGDKNILARENQIRILDDAIANAQPKAAATVAPQNSSTNPISAQAAPQAPAPTIKFGQNTFTLEEAKAHRAYLQQALDNGAITNDKSILARENQIRILDDKIADAEPKTAALSTANKIPAQATAFSSRKINFGQNTFTLEEAKAHRAYLQQALDNGAITNDKSILARENQIRILDDKIADAELN